MRMDAISQREWELLEERLDLPRRQMDVVRAIIAGKRKPQAIAHALGITTASAKTHVGRVFANLGVHSKIELVVEVFMHLLDMRPPPPPPPAPPGSGPSGTGNAR